MSTQLHLTIPDSVTDKRAALGRATIKLAEEMRLSAHTATQERPKHIPKGQEWFWTPEWQAGEREADEAFARGDYKEFSSVEEMLAELHARV